MFGLIKALLDIHHVRISEPGMPEEHLPSTMRGHFKRAAAQRKKKDTASPNEESADGNIHGTRTYGAPECYWPNDFIRSSCLSVDQNVDISSLGCVFSEAAVWVIKGRMLEKVGKEEQVPEAHSLCHRQHRRQSGIQVFMSFGTCPTKDANDPLRPSYNRFGQRAQNPFKRP
ncbi:hypothetical protein MPH_00810 [Macrophomina phaseolina MS6]|uniref:Protein kinase domain-containing protein n=1 Tax=Macrophomina phaseolina (strain MS6) TaxID=1126212 RepID=K2SZ46_MACPH|nr:hypothetical protein MPH_00810 [Macrophomina phaseolina MS6]